VPITSSLVHVFPAVCTAEDVVDLFARQLLSLDVLKSHAIFRNVALMTPSESGRGYSLPVSEWDRCMDTSDS
jgi:hypothetical protein